MTQPLKYVLDDGTDVEVSHTTDRTKIIITHLKENKTLYSFTIKSIEAEGLATMIKLMSTILTPYETN